MICSNVPEATATSLEGRRKEEEAHWAKLCSQMGINVRAVALTRLVRKNESPHATKPRLLRAVLNSSGDVESVLLAAYLLKGKTEERIFPDIPWIERQKLRQLPPSEERAERDKRAIFIHGVPESPDSNAVSQYQHDCREWQFIQTLLDEAQLITTEVIRIPSTAPGLRRDPRLLKIMLLTPDMAQRCLRASRAHRATIPPEIRLHAARRSTATPAEATTRTPEIQHEALLENPSSHQLLPNLPVAKNGSLPVQARPAKPAPTDPHTPDFSPPRTYAAVMQTCKA